jgi:hypothetical protein
MGSLSKSEGRGILYNRDTEHLSQHACVFIRRNDWCKVDQIAHPKHLLKEV